MERDSITWVRWVDFGSDLNKSYRAIVGFKAAMSR